MENMHTDVWEQRVNMLKKYRNSPTARLPLYYLNLRYDYLIIKCEEISWKILISERVS